MPLTDPLVLCLCAKWCRSCGEYASRFEQVSHLFDGVAFLWIDIEDEADLVDPVEVDNFPTILIAHGTQAVFFGTVLPHVQTLERLVQSFLDDTDAKPLADAQLLSLVARVRQSKPVPTA